MYDLIVITGTPLVHVGRDIPGVVTNVATCHSGVVLIADPPNHGGWAMTLLDNRGSIFPHSPVDTSKTRLFTGCGGKSVLTLLGLGIVFS